MDFPAVFHASHFALATMLNAPGLELVGVKDDVDATLK
jgi:hypothetical protein